jgi:hypothetical protein
MTWLYVIFYTFLSLLVVENTYAITSPIQPYTNYRYSTELQPDVADLWWTINETEQDILFELHIKTTGWIALGISPGISLYIILFLYLSRSFHFSHLDSWWNDRC